MFLNPNWRPIPTPRAFAHDSLAAKCFAAWEERWAWSSSSFGEEKASKAFLALARIFQTTNVGKICADTKITVTYKGFNQIHSNESRDFVLVLSKCISSLLRNLCLRCTAFGLLIFMLFLRNFLMCALCMGITKNLQTDVSPVRIKDLVLLRVFVITCWWAMASLWVLTAQVIRCVLPYAGDTHGARPIGRRDEIDRRYWLAINTRNVAADITAILPPCASRNAYWRIRFSLRDAKSLKGGTFLVTPLLGADSSVYAVARCARYAPFQRMADQGPLYKGRPTSALISNGAIVMWVPLSAIKACSTSLRNPDLTTAQRVQNVINEHLFPWQQHLTPRLLSWKFLMLYKKIAASAGWNWRALCAACSKCPCRIKWKRGDYRDRAWCTYQYCCCTAATWRSKLKKNLCFAAHSPTL